MQILNEQEKRDSLRQLLMDLSKSQDVLKDRKDRRDYYLRLEAIYYNTDSDNYRHFYSDIFACLSLIDADDSLGNLDILAQNMEAIKEGYIPINRDEAHNNELIDIRKEIIKLYDHTNLDISRINYTKRMARETQSELARAKVLIEDLKNKLAESDVARAEAVNHLNTESSKLKEEVRDGQKKMQNEYITILGIFAAIVLAFTGGMTFSSSVLENIDKASIYRMIAIVLILGLVLSNLIWLLIDFLRDINGKSIRKWWLIAVTDVVLLLGLLLTFLSYKNHWLDVSPRASISTEAEQHIEGNNATINTEDEESETSKSEKEITTNKTD
ncbi:MAG: hypothetical protein MSA26_08105 [Lachnospiraceae bacterium]|nr:hypothetical protein [Lachnospiraceae bacterium]MCI7180523.1 hypothetical protein [Lachnospiraceae bacterium]